MVYRSLFFTALARYVVSAPRRLSDSGIALRISCLILSTIIGGLAPAQGQTGGLDISTYSRRQITALIIGQQGSRIFGIAASGRYVFSDDHGFTWTDTGSPAQKSTGQLVFHGGWKFAITLDGNIYRSLPSEWNLWTVVSVPQRPVGTRARPDSLVGCGDYLFFGNYTFDADKGAHVYRSPDYGDTWVEVLSLPKARHVHAIGCDTANPGHLFVSIGDANFEDIGLWYSSSYGSIGSFAHLSSNYYGIDFAFPPRVPPSPYRVLIEGDGPLGPQILSYDQSMLSAPSPTEALIRGDSNPSDGRGTWEGTARGIAMTAKGDLFWISYAEGAPNRHRSGLWMAAGPNFDRPVLLEEMVKKWSSIGKTVQSGPFLFNFIYRLRIPLPIGSPSTRTVITGGASSMSVGKTVTFSAVVSSDSPGVPTGMIHISDGITPIGSATLDEKGTATFDVAFKTGGLHAIKVEYEGDSVFMESVASIENLQVDPPPLGYLDRAVGVGSRSTHIPRGGVMQVIGWAVDVKDGASIQRVEVQLDGVALGTAMLGNNRPDVAAYYHRPDYQYSGWCFIAALPGLTPGNHTVTAVVFNEAGASKPLNSQIITIDPVPLIRGDVNGDGVVDMRDVMLEMQFFLGLQAPPQFDVADVLPTPGLNGRPFGRGEIHADDVNWILRRSIGLEGGTVGPDSHALVTALTSSARCQ